MSIQHRLFGNRPVFTRDIFHPAFKTNVISLYIVRPLSSREASMGTLLGNILSFASKEFPSLKAISNEEDNLMGASVYFDMNKYRDQIVFEYKVVFPNYKFLDSSNDLTERLEKFYLSILTEPYLDKDGLFDEAIFQSEKRQLLDDLENLQKNPSAYAHRRCVELHFKGTPYGIYKYGDLETLKSITRQELTEYYYELLTSERIYLYRHGDFENHVGRDRCESVSVERLGIDHTKKEETEEFDINQSILVQAYLSDFRYDHPLISASQVAAELLGGDTTSLLFQSLREEHSSVYYAYTKYDKYRATMFLHTAFEEKEWELVRTEIESCVERIKKGDFTDSAFEVARLNCALSMISLYDKQMTRVDYEFLQDLFGMKHNLNERVEIFNRVTREDVIEAMKHFELTTSFRLIGVKNE
ncbi:M16 family metallopeptidase [Guggenheimella bovis]